MLIPHQRSRHYALSRIIGDYSFSDNDPQELWHSRKVSILKHEIPRSAFSKTLQYSMGAYRTVFKIRDEEDLQNILKPYVEKHKEAPVVLVK